MTVLYQPLNFYFYSFFFMLTLCFYIFLFNIMIRYESEFINTIVEEVYKKVAFDKFSECLAAIENVASESVDVIGMWSLL
jgi:hypothetical protein